MARQSFEGFVSGWRDSPPLPEIRFGRSAGDGRIEHLGRDLQDVEAFSSDEEPDHEGESHLVQHQGPDPVATTAMPENASGKLKRVSDSRLQKKPVQRKIALPKAGRKSVYDIDESPQKLPLKEPLDARPEISPLRQQRRTANVTSSKLEQTEIVLDEEATRNVSDGLQPPNDDEVELIDTPKARRSPRKKPVVATSLQEASGAAESDGSSDNLFIRQHDGIPGTLDQEQTNEPAPDVTPAKEKPGRLSKVQRVPVSACGRPRNERSVMHENEPEQEAEEPIAHIPQPKPVGKMIPKEPRMKPIWKIADATAEQLRIEKVGTSTVQFNNGTDQPAGNDDEDDKESEDETAPRRLKQKQREKRPRSGQPQTQGNTSKRPKGSRYEQVMQSRPAQKTGDEAMEEDEVHIASQSSQSHDEDDADRLLGQWSVLKQAVRGLKKIGVSRDDIALEDEDVAGIMDLALLAKKKLNCLREPRQDAECGPDPPEQIAQIKHWIEMLCGKNENMRPDFKDKRKINNIYFHLFPLLIKLLIRMIECYEAMDIDESAPGISLSIPHLREIKSFISQICQMGLGAKKYARPASSLAIVRPVDRYIVAPLREVHDAFSKYLVEIAGQQKRLEDEAREAERQARKEAQEEENRRRRREIAQKHEEEQARRDAMREAQAAEARKQKEKLDALEAKWNTMHDERYWAEGRPGMSRQKVAYLERPKHSDPEEDHNGDLFERVQAFRPRIGPPPAAIQKVKARGSWSAAARRALREGLKRWAGEERVFEKIIRQYCRKHGPLVEYNVTDIVVTAALLKEHYYLEQRDQVEEWVVLIPNWTKPSTLLEEPVGLEDEGGEEDYGDYEDVDALYG